MSFLIHISDDERAYLDGLPLSSEAKERVRQFVERFITDIPDEFRLKLQGIQSTSDIAKEEMEQKLTVASDQDPFSEDSPFDFSNQV